MVCHIVGAGSCATLPTLRDGDFLIAADGGYLHLMRAAMKPDLIIGDFDSFEGDLPTDTEIVRLPVRKDDTDMLAAVKEGIGRGYRDFYFYGAVGGRADHTYANYQTLAFLSKRGLHGRMIDGGYCVSAVTNGTLTLDGAYGTVSVFAFDGTAHGVTLEGLEYPLTDATLTADFPLGVSNHVMEHPARVTVREGTLLVMYECGASGKE